MELGLIWCRLTLNSLHIEDDLECMTSCLCFLSAKITSLGHHTWFVRCWKWSHSFVPVGQALFTEIHPQPSVVVGFLFCFWDRVCLDSPNFSWNRCVAQDDLQLLAVSLIWESSVIMPSSECTFYLPVPMALTSWEVPKVGTVQSCLHPSQLQGCGV